MPAAWCEVASGSCCVDMIVRFSTPAGPARHSKVPTVVIGMLILWAAQRKPIALAGRQTFDASEEGWFGYGRGAHVRVTTDPQHVRQGIGALELGAQIGSSMEQLDYNLLFRWFVGMANETVVNEVNVTMALTFSAAC